MNIVKGVAGFLRKSSPVHLHGRSIGSQDEELTMPWPEIMFSGDDMERVLESKWEKYEALLEKEEKEKALESFLSHFLKEFQDWKPIDLENQLVDDCNTDEAKSEPATPHCIYNTNDVIKGCTFGHPTRVILVLTQEMKTIADYLTEWQSFPELGEISPSPSRIGRGLKLLDALCILTRSEHNQKIFSYYGGFQMLVALMKVAVLRLKEVTSAISVGESLSYSLSLQFSFLKCLLAHTVSIVTNFIDTNFKLEKQKKLQSHSSKQPSLKNSFEGDNVSYISQNQVMSLKSLTSTQKMTIPLLETGGLNWFVELLRVLKILRLKKCTSEIPLEFLTLRALKGSLILIPRAQNHFRTIGGLAALLDGAEIIDLKEKLTASFGGYDSSLAKKVFEDFELQMLYLEVLKEALYGNMNCLLSIFDNGAKNISMLIRWAAFVLPNFNISGFDIACNIEVGTSNSDFGRNGTQSFVDGSTDRQSIISERPRDTHTSQNMQGWNSYVAHISRILWSFLLPNGDVRSLSNDYYSDSVAGLSLSYMELVTKWIIRVFMSVFMENGSVYTVEEMLPDSGLLSSTLQNYILYAFRKLLEVLPSALKIFRDERVWDMLFSKYFFYFKLKSEMSSLAALHSDQLNGQTLMDREPNSTDSSVSLLREILPNLRTEAIQMEVVAVVELAATATGCNDNTLECLALLSALRECSCNPPSITMLSKSLHRILQLASEQTIFSFRKLEAIERISNVLQSTVECLKMAHGMEVPTIEQEAKDMKHDSSEDLGDHCLDAVFGLMEEYFTLSGEAKTIALYNNRFIDNLFSMLWTEHFRKFALNHILYLLKLPRSSEAEREATLGLSLKYFETFPCTKESSVFDKRTLWTEMLAGVRDVIKTDRKYYQALFRDGECFIHIVTLLNGSCDEGYGEQLCIDVLKTLTDLLSDNQTSKVAFRSLVGSGYKTLERLLLDCNKGGPNMALLKALLDMLVDGTFFSNVNKLIENEDVIMLFFTILYQSNNDLKSYGLQIFYNLLEESTANRAVCVRAGLLSFLLDWFGTEESELLISWIGMLINLIGGHSITGKDMRKIFVLLRSTKDGARPKYSTGLLNILQSMLREGGPSVYFDLNGHDSGIVVTSPVRWPSTRGFTFSCWLRIENFPQNDEMMGLFSFLTESGKGCTALFDKERILLESVSSKRQTVSLKCQMSSKQWIFLCITHSAGRAFSGGNTLKCYVNGCLVGSEKLRYPKVVEPLTRCTIGTSMQFDATSDFKSEDFASKLSSAFCGQLGPVYLFEDALSSDQILGIFSLGPMYMYSFLDTEVGQTEGNIPTYGILDLKDGLATKIVFGFNAQASASRLLFDISPILDQTKDRKIHEATIIGGSQLCYRSVMRDILDCVGGVSVLFPLLTQLDQPLSEMPAFHLEQHSSDDKYRDHVAAQVIELISAVLDSNLANQQVMWNISGFSILGFLLQSVSPQHLTHRVISGLGQLLEVIEKSDSKVSESLVQNILLRIHLNPHIWIYTHFTVQRDLYMYLLSYFDSHSALISHLCRLPRILDIIWQFYWDQPNNRQAFGSKPLLHPLTKDTIGERPNREEIGKLRLLLLSLAEMVLRQNVTRSDVISLVAFLERSEDLHCIEDVLHMILRLLYSNSFVTSFVEHVLSLGGLPIFLNLLKRTSEIIRLQGLQIIGKLMVAIPNEKKGIRLFTLGVGIPRISFENQQNDKMRSDVLLSVMADRLLCFPLSDSVLATILDVLLGGASPKQVLQKVKNPEKQLDKRNSSASISSHFALPQIMNLLFKLMKNCDDYTTREQTLRDLQKLLEANTSNIECLISEYGWQAWLLSILSNVELNKDDTKISLNDDTEKTNVELLIRGIFCIIHFYCICSVKGGWHHIEQTLNFVKLYLDQGHLSKRLFMHDLIKDLVQGLLDVASEQELLGVQPCRDNTLYLLTIIDEMIINDTHGFLQFPCSGLSDALSSDNVSLEGSNKLETSNSSRFRQAPFEDSSTGSDLRKKSTLMNENRGWQKSSSENENAFDNHCWQLYDIIWVLVSEMNGKGSIKKSGKSSTSAPSFGQRARGLVESLNVPAVEMAAAVVSGGIGAVVNINANKLSEKAIRLRGDKFPRIMIRLILLYLYKADLERASQFVQQFVVLLPSFLSADSEQLKNRLQLFIWSLLFARTQVGSHDNGARFHLISQLIRETVRCGTNTLAMSIADRENSVDSDSSFNEAGSVNSLLHKDRILAAVKEDAEYTKSTLENRQKQIMDLHSDVVELISLESEQKKVLEDQLQSNLSIVISNDGSRKVASRLAYDEDQQLITEKWCHLFRDLTDERGAWSTIGFPNKSLTHWKLDRTEDPCRRRLKLKRNYNFDEQLCQPPKAVVDMATTGTVNEDAHFSLRNLGLGEVRSFLLKGLRRISEEEGLDISANEEDNACKALSDEVITNKNDTSEQNDNAEDTDDSNIKQEQAIKFSETGDEEVILSVSCVLVTPKWKMAGHLDIMKKFLHFYGEFLVEGTGGSRTFTSLGGLNYPNSDTHHPERSKSSANRSTLRTESDNDKGNAMERFDPVQQRSFSGKQKRDVKRHRRWDISKIKSVHLARYLLRFTAIEIFSSSVAPVFINFATEKYAKDVGKQVVSLRNEMPLPRQGTKYREETLYLVDRRLAVELAEKARDMWRRRDISNFEYLMILNTLAGRSYNDLTQYPVFPWILADYTSSSLDLNNSSTFRDLSKPVGALNAKRLEMFEERYQNFCDPDIPSFYYGSHYSSMGSVLFYLLRLEPFTTLHRNLQGGRFDHADRLFHSIESVYANCLSNTSDVKELIPEFFYMPEFLFNSNGYHLGIKQDGESLGDVVLPPWAKNSPEEFIYKNREALESEHVSANLHQWIDLIFGYKQRGKPAVEATNVFYHLTYEGAVDLDAIEDPLQRAAVEDQIANFGQTPIQLFRKKHPKRGTPIPIAHPLYYAPASITLTSVVSAGFEDPSAVVFVGVIEPAIVLVSQGLVISVKTWLTSQLQCGGNFTFSSSQEPFFGIGSDVSVPRKIVGPLAENLDLTIQCFGILTVQSSNFLLCCGNWDNSFRVVSLNDGRMVQSIRLHKDLVSCVSVASDGSFVVTGSHDTTVMVWEVALFSRVSSKRSRDLQSLYDRTRKDHVLVDKPLHILCGHDDIVTCVAVSVELDVVVSASKDSSCIFYALRQGRYIRSIQHPAGCPISKIVLSQDGRLVLYSNEDLNLYLYSVNGKHIASSASNGRINSMALSGCGDFLVCSGDKGQIMLRSMQSLEILCRYETLGKNISSLAVTPEDCFLVGTQDGHLLLYSIETSQQHRVNLIQNIKSRTYSRG